MPRIPALLGLVALIVLGAASPARANTISIFTLSGTTSCLSTSCTGPVTGTFGVDITAGTIAGPWFISTALGSLSSADPGAFAFIFPNVLGGTPSGLVPVDEINFSAGSFAVQFNFFPQHTPFVGGNTNFAEFFGPGFSCGSGFSCGNASVSATPSAVTPEPSSMLLLGGGLIGLAGSAARKLLP